MFKLLILSALLALGTTKELDKISGNWTYLKFWPFATAKDFSPVCVSATFTTTNDFTKCGDKDVPIIILDAKTGAGRYPVIVVQTHEEVTEALKVKCDGYKAVYVTRHISDNYRSFHVATTLGDLTMLAAKSIPTEAEMDELVSRTHGLKETAGYTICVQDMKSLVERYRTQSALKHGK